MKKMCVCIVILFIATACRTNVCSGDSICSSLMVILVDCPKHEKVELYIYPKGFDFSTYEQTIEYKGDATVHGRETTFTFMPEFLKSKDYRLVLDDTVYFDFDNMVFDVHVDSLHWNMSGPTKGCKIFYMEVNGVPVDEKYLYRNYFEVPYSMHRVVKDAL